MKGLNWIELEKGGKKKNYFQEGKFEKWWHKDEIRLVVFYYSEVWPD